MEVIKPNNPHIFKRTLREFSGQPAEAVIPGKYEIANSKGVTVAEGSLLRGDPGSGEFSFDWNAPGDNLENPYEIRWKVKTANEFINESSYFEIFEPPVEDFSFIQIGRASCRERV